MVEINKLKILVIDGDTNLSGFLCNYFVRQDWQGIPINFDTDSFLGMLNNEYLIADIVVINGEYPESLNRLLTLRHQIQAPVVILAGMSGQRERTRYLESGADVCLPQPPLCPDELVAQIKALLRRYRISETLSVQPFVVNFDDIGEFRFDFSARCVQINGAILRLTPVEYNLLRELVLNYERILPHNQIIRKIWGGVEIDNPPAYLYTCIKTLRRKIEFNPGQPKHITTISKVGYCFHS